MKINNREISGPNKLTVVIPRPPFIEKNDEGEEREVSGDLVFHLQAVLDFVEFDRLVPPISPPNKIVPGGKPEQDFTAPNYVKAEAERSTRRFHWMILKSLEPTDGLVWDTVDMSKPETFGNYEADFKSAGLAMAEINRIIAGIMEVNSLDEDKLEQARKRFLAGKGHK